MIEVVIVSILSGEWRNERDCLKREDVVELLELCESEEKEGERWETAGGPGT